jgi:hypothetical protein
MITLIGFGNASAATTYYISKSAGSDSNNGTSKSTPWAHFPGQDGATSNAATYQPVAGDQFILKGGDTWTGSEVGWNSNNWSNSGTQANPIYIGVDRTWFTGGSWVRPKFDCQTTACGTHDGGGIFWLSKDWVILDNFEVTGYQQGSTGNAIFGVGANNDEVKNMYIHGFSRSSATVNSNCFVNNWSGGGGNGTKFDFNVCDGSDSPNKDFMGGILHADQAYNNVLRYVYNGINGVATDFHGNLVENNYTSASGDHCNEVRITGAQTGNTVYIYNNVIRNGNCSGGMTIYSLADTNNTTSVEYVYNNVIYNNVGEQGGIVSGGHLPTGTYYTFNNTIDNPPGYCIGNGETTTSSTTHYANNHCISSGVFCQNAGTNCINDGGNLQQTEGQASANVGVHFDQYKSSETYAYSPVVSTNSTVGGGVNLTSYCSGNVAALCSDTTYASYDSVNHVVVMRSVNPRPASGAWDIGSYLFNGGDRPPNPPTALSVVIH